MDAIDDQTCRLIQWNVETLLSLIKEVAARRPARTRRKSKKIQLLDDASSATFEVVGNPLEEVREIIALPDFDQKTSCIQQDPENIEIPEVVVTQLHHLVTCIASMYNDNPFHK